MSTRDAWIDYTNHRGERSWRNVIPAHIECRESEWHPGRQWLLVAFDVDKRAVREFALASIHKWQAEPPSPEQQIT